MDDPESYFNTLLLLGIFKSISIGTIVSLFILIILLIFSALISGSEVAYFSLNPTEKEELDSAKFKSHSTIKLLLEKPKHLLAAILISNNFINVGIIILSTYVANNVIDFSNISEVASFFIQVGCITFAILLFGEIIPKVYATKNALTLAKLMSYPLLYLKKIFKPITFLLIYSSNIVDNRIKRKGLDVSVGELSHALDLAEDIAKDKDEHKILKGIIKFGETTVKQVMKARVDVIAIDKKTSLSKIIEIILNSGFSRIPVYDESFDKIIGILYVKDLIPYIKETSVFNWKFLIRNPFFVPENKKLADLLKEFQHKKVHLAIVVDEYGGTSGIVTLEDILEEIVGEISDEFDGENLAYSKLDDNTYVFEGKTSLNDVCRILNIDDKSIFDDAKKETDSLAGLIIELSGKIPQKNEKIHFKNFTFIIESSDKRRIKHVKLIKETIEENEA